MKQGTGVYYPFEPIQWLRLNTARVFNPEGAEASGFAYAYPLDTIINDEQRTGAIDMNRFAAFEEELYAGIANKRIPGLWSEDETVVNGVSTDMSIQQLIQFNSAVYAKSDPAIGDKYWSGGVDQINIDSLDNYKRAILAAFDTHEFQQIWRSTFGYEPPDDAIDKLVGANHALYEELGEDRTVALLSLSPEWTLSAWFTVPDTSESVLVGIDAGYLTEFNSDDVYVLTNMRVPVDCGAQLYCGDRFVSWDPKARIDIVDALRQ